MFYLSEHVYCCESGDGAILLDIRGGSYLGIPASALADMRIRIANWPGPKLSRTSNPVDFASESAGAGAADLVKTLSERGLLTATVTPLKPPILTTSSGSIALAGRAMSNRLPSMQRSIPFFVALLRARRYLKSASLEPMLMAFSEKHRRQKWPTPNQEHIVDLLSAYTRLQAWTFTAQDACLLDSIALTLFLTAHRIRSTFLIGVTTKPFLAHAWVQVGDQVLNDTAEHVQQYEPILAVGA